MNTQKNCQKKKNTFNSLSLSFRKKNLSKLSPRFHAWSRVSCRSIDLLLSFEHANISERFTADRDEQISGEGWILINRKLIVPKVGLSLSTERLPSARERGMSAAGPLCSTATEEDSSHVELGGWRTWAERTQTLGVALLQWR